MCIKQANIRTWVILTLDSHSESITSSADKTVAKFYFQCDGGHFRNLIVVTLILLEYKNETMQHKNKGLWVQGNKWFKLHLSLGRANEAKRFPGMVTYQRGLMPPSKNFIFHK